MELQTLGREPKATRTVYPARPNVSFMNQGELMVIASQNKFSGNLASLIAGPHRVDPGLAVAPVQYPRPDPDPGLEPQPQA
jgi:hypothetical protein